MRLKHKVRINIADKSGKKQEVLQSEHREHSRKGCSPFIFENFAKFSC